MKLLALLVLVLLCIGKPQVNAETRTVRLTFYWAHGSDTDNDTRHHKSATGMKLREGFSAAADPDIFPYGSRIVIPQLGERVIHDTGSAIVTRKAARQCGRNCPVIDVFFDSEEDALEVAKNIPEFVKVKIL